MKESADVYSYGVVLWELLVEELPWRELSHVQVMSQVAVFNRRLAIPAGKAVDASLAPLQQLMESCFVEADLRPAFDEGMSGALRDMILAAKQQVRKAKLIAECERDYLCMCMCMCMSVYVCLCVWLCGSVCVFVSVWKRERERGRES